MSFKDANELLTQSLDPPAARRALLQASEENALPPVRRCRCVVLDVPATAQPDDFSHIMPGTVTAFVAREDDLLLRALTATLEANNSADFNAVTARLERMGAEFSRTTATAAIHTDAPLHTFPSFAELRYATKTLVGHVHLDDVLRVHVHVFPYNGGFLDKAHFSMVEYHRTGVNTPLVCVLLVRQPILSDMEREALRLAPAASSVHNIEAVAPQDTMRVLVMMADAAARFVYNEFVNLVRVILHGSSALGAAPDAVLRSDELHKMLEALPPEVTAAELLRLRADVLLQERRRPL
jgi:hypothetical protein